MNYIDIETAYKNADWAEVIRLLDNHFGDNPTPNYSTLNATIENALTQGQQPTVANQQALKMIINRLKETENETTPDQVHQEQQRNQGFTEKHKEFYEYLLKFPYHAQHNTVTDYFRKEKGFKANIFCLSGYSKSIKELPKFGIIVEHFLPSKVTKGSVSTDVLGYTRSNFATDAETIASNFIDRFKEKESSNVREQFFTLVKAALRAKSLILPYTIIEKADKLHYQRLEEFIKDYWQPLIDSIQGEIQSPNGASHYGDHAIVLVILLENTNTTLRDFSLLKKAIRCEQMPEKLKIQIDKAEHKKCNSWVGNSDGFFWKGGCESITDNWNQDYIPECGTIEGLLEKITDDVFETKITLHDILKHAKTN